MFKFIDLFAGAGGLSLGFEETGKFEVRAFVENNENAVKTYKKNNGENITHYSDILSLDFNDVSNELGEIDLVIGGPPCQGFSNANRNRRKIINGSNELVKRYVEAIRVLKPKAFVMENVKTIESRKHFFCLTEEDKAYINDELHLDVQNQKIVLYDRTEHMEELYNAVKNNIYNEWTQIEESQLYVLKNMVKKASNNASTIEMFLSKSANKKVINSIISTLENENDEPEWISSLNKEISAILKYILSNNKADKKSIDRLKLFNDIQRLFIGIDELKGHKAIYSTERTFTSIDINLSTYVVIDFIREVFKHLGYKINSSVLKAVEFGVPQNRERFIMIGVREDILGDRNIDMPEPMITDAENYITVKEAIEDLKEYNPATEDMSNRIEIDKSVVTNRYLQEIIYRDDSNIVYNHVCTASRDEAKKRFEQIKQGENFHSLPDALKDTYANPGRTQNTIYKRLEYDKPSDTVVNVRKSMWIHPELDRAISAREAARLQSFPDDYEFVGTKDSVYQQIGNAVPPLLGRAIAEKVLDILEADVEHKELDITLKSIIDNN